jgi:hypothetical protein
VDSLVACPIFAAGSNDKESYVSLVLFADSAEREFFDADVLAMISAASRGFVRLLEDLLVQRAIRQVPTYYSGFKVEAGAELEELIVKLRALGVDFIDPDERGWKEGLTFKALKSLELEVGPSMRMAV